MNAKQCCAAGCARKASKAGKLPIRLHQFPRDAGIATQCLEILELQPLDLKEIRRRDLKLCSLHFDDEAYTCPAELRHEAGARLAWNALPNLEKVLPRLSPEGLQPVVARSDAEADNLYPPQLTREDQVGQVHSESYGSYHEKASFNTPASIVKVHRSQQELIKELIKEKKLAKKARARDQRGKSKFLNYMLLYILLFVFLNCILLYYLFICF